MGKFASFLGIASSLVPKKSSIDIEEKFLHPDEIISFMDRTYKVLKSCYYIERINCYRVLDKFDGICILLVFKEDGSEVAHVNLKDYLESKDHNRAY